MLEIKTSVLIKFISALFFLFSGVIWKKILLPESKNYHYIFFRTISSLLILILLSIVFNDSKIDIIEIKLIEWATYFGICLFSFWGLYFYTSAIQKGRFSFVTSLAPISSVFSFVFSLLIYNETLSYSKYIALIMITIGLLIHQKEKITQLKLSGEVILVLLFGFFWGISFVLYLIPIKKIGVLNFSILLEISVFISCIGLLLFNEKRVLPKNIGKQNLFLCLFMGVMVALGSLLSNFSLTQLPVSLNILIGMSFEIIVLAIGLFIFNEKLNYKDWVLIFLASFAGFLFLV